jgi:hypothetical protein
LDGQKFKNGDPGNPLYLNIVQHLPAGTSPADFITSLEVTARKSKVATAS